MDIWMFKINFNNTLDILRDKSKQTKKKKYRKLDKNKIKNKIIGRINLDTFTFIPIRNG